MIPVTFFAATDIVVIGQNSEMADYVNPRGHIYGHASYVYAEGSTGQRKRFFVAAARSESEALQPAVQMAEALTVRLTNGKLPVAFHSWDDAFPAYGSHAYDEQDTIEWERSLED